MQLQKEKRKFEKWIKIKQIDIKKWRKKSKENELEGLIWKCKGLCTIFRRKERKEKKDVGDSSKVQRAHASHIDEDEDKMNLIMRYNQFFYHCMQPHALLEKG
jgi:hypothetical protein